MTSQLWITTWLWFQLRKNKKSNEDRADAANWYKDLGFEKCFLNLSLNMPCISTNSVQASHFLHIIIICYLWSIWQYYSDRCEVTSHFFLWFAFLFIIHVEHLFTCLLICIPSLRNVFSDLLPIFYSGCLFFWYWVI